MAKVSSKYLELIRSFPLRPIRSEAELDRAEAMLHQLLDAPSLSAAEQDYLEILGNLIEEYESKAHPIEPLPPHQMLAMSIESKGVSQMEVSRATGIPVSTISELIAQKRKFNRAHIEKLCAYFGLDPKAFIHVPSTALVPR
ncbi:MAG: transcriptional regulator [Acidobacteria bacterium]|nr:MAG: transcriptional regulator [Acidobacteriota bacterium]